MSRCISFCSSISLCVSAAFFSISQSVGCFIFVTVNIIIAIIIRAAFYVLTEYNNKTFWLCSRNHLFPLRNNIYLGEEFAAHDRDESQLQWHVPFGISIRAHPCFANFQIYYRFLSARRFFAFALSPFDFSSSAFITHLMRICCKVV